VRQRLRGVALLAGVAAALSAGALVGCGGDTTGGVTDLTGTGDLAITYVPDVGVTPRTAALVCPADGVDGRQACEQLEGLGDPFAEVAPDTACTAVYGGPEQMRVAGTWEGRAVERTFTRTNGCEIDAYASVAPALLPLVGGPGGG
jgi:hypothetical protein